MISDFRFQIFIKKFKKNQIGATALLMTMFILTGIFIISLAASQLVNNGLILGRTQVNSTKAYFAAEAGAERILWEVRSFNSGLDIERCVSSVPKKCFLFTDPIDGDIDPNAPCEVTCDESDENQTQVLSNDSYYTIEYNESGNDIEFKSKGSFQDVARAVLVKFSVVREDCDDEFGVDEDGDGLVNCADHISCDNLAGPGGGTCYSSEVGHCSDSYDNDGDGDSSIACGEPDSNCDCDDSDCELDISCLP